MRLLALVLIASSLQLPNALLRIGSLERQLTEEDVVNIERALPAGQKPWLMVGAHGQTWAKTVIVFLQPATTTATLRSGSVIVLTRPYSGPTAAWNFLDKTDYGRFAFSDAYAQVAIEGRDFDQVKSDTDNNRPFFVDGRFTDDELVGIAKYIRSGPGTVAPGPITSVVRHPDGSFEAWIALKEGYQVAQIQGTHALRVIRVGTVGI